MIEFKNVTKIFSRNIKAVNEVSFFVKKGTISCLIGSSGCGKTTTLKIANRLIEPTTGEVLLNNRNIFNEDPVNLRRSIGYVIQGGGLMPHMNIERNIAIQEEVLKGRAGIDRKRVSELLELVDLPPEDFRDRYPSQLSGGQQQRVGIARSLMLDPPVLLMDEPFGALDPITRHRLQQEFLQLNKRLEKTIIFVTHDLSEAFKLGDEIILMSEGAIVQKGIKSDFLKQPASEYAREFVESQLT